MLAQCHSPDNLRLFERAGCSEIWLLALVQLVRAEMSAICHSNHVVGLFLPS